MFQTTDELAMAMSVLDIYRNAKRDYLRIRKRQEVQNYILDHALGSEQSKVMRRDVDPPPTMLPSEGAGQEWGTGSGDYGEGSDGGGLPVPWEGLGVIAADTLAVAFGPWIAGGVSAAAYFSAGLDEEIY